MYGLIFFSSDAGWSSLAARRAHNPKVTGSNPVPATSITDGPVKLFSNRPILFSAVAANAAFIAAATRIIATIPARIATTCIHTTTIHATAAFAKVLPATKANAAGAHSACAPHFATARTSAVTIDLHSRTPVSHLAITPGKPALPDAARQRNDSINHQYLADSMPGTERVRVLREKP